MSSPMHGIAVKQQNAIRKAKTIPGPIAMCRQTISKASKQYDGIETQSIMGNMANCYLASVNPQLEAKYTAKDYFYNRGQKFASLSEQNQDKVMESILNYLLVDVVASDRKQLEDYIQFEALKSKQRYRI